MRDEEPIEAKRTAPSGKVARKAQELARTLLIYGLLIGGAMVFTLPFIWMMGTSFKVDREMFGEDISLMPGTPVPASASPFLDTRYIKAPKHPGYERVKGTIADELKSRNIPHVEDADNADAAVSIITPGVFKKLLNTLPNASWKLDDAALETLVREKMSDDMIDEIARQVYRFLAFGPVRVRSQELQEKVVSDGLPISSFWSIDTEQAEAKLVDRERKATPQANLAYSFEGDDNGQIELSRTLRLPFAADRLARIQISVTPDDSWHRMDFYVEKGGALYKNVAPEYLGEFLPKVITLQEFGPDDLPDSNKIKLWTAYKEIDRGDAYEADPNKVKVTMVVTQQTQLQTWWAKCTRNYRQAMKYIPFWRYVSTSIFLVVLNIIGSVLSCSLVAYAFSRLQWPGRNLCFGLMLATMMIPPQVTMIPYFLIIKHLGWYNTLKPLWVISFFGNAFNVFLLRQFMKGIPKDLEDAAKIDGCNFLHIYWYVIMPLIKPTLACIAIFTFMGVWNDFMGPLIYVSDQRLYPLSLGLYALNVQEGGNFGMMMAGSLMMTLPVIAIFFFAQKYFIQGVTLTGVKG